MSVSGAQICYKLPSMGVSSEAIAVDEAVRTVKVSVIEKHKKLPGAAAPGVVLD